MAVDANAVFAAMLRGGVTRKIIFNRSIQLYAPRFLVDEVMKHYALFEKRSGMKRDGFARLTAKVLKRIRVATKDELAPYADAARHLSTDRNDLAYGACALAMAADLWSNDKGFKTGRIAVWRTEELAGRLGLA